jgi:hypothetical protein
VYENGRIALGGRDRCSPSTGRGLTLRHDALMSTLPIALSWLMVAGPAPARAQRVILSAGVGDTTIDLDVAVPPTRVPPGRGRLAALVQWTALRPGIALGSLELHAGLLRTPVHAVLVRVDPSRLRFALQLITAANGMTGAWTLDSAPAAAVLAMNAGQFKETGPWGWLVIAGEERRNPGRAPLSIGIRIDTAGRLAWVRRGREEAARSDPTIAYAFQSFPLLVFDHRMPPAVRDPGITDMGHRDARLLMAETDDGALLFVLTRYAALGTMAERVPIGLNMPESVVLAAALGVRHAVMLDGGTSAQLAVRDGTGREARWPGLRRVPLALIAFPRKDD